jgi:precorrin-6A/cobalt-precorrin-6A reductase
MTGEPARLLILGGTAEAAVLAGRLAKDRRLAKDPRVRVITSLAGRTRNPAALRGEVRTGGFGGPEGLAAYLKAEAIELVVDATHPFAARISGNAEQACRAGAVPRLVLTRPPWQAEPGDRWTEVPSVEAAARALPKLGQRAFLSVGRQALSAFAELRETWFLVRLIDPPDGSPPLARHRLVLGRGPFDEAAESALLRHHRIDVVVSKNSGGAATYGKIAAARGIGLPVVMVSRPPTPEGEVALTLDQALAWIDQRVS